MESAADSKRISMQASENETLRIKTNEAFLYNPRTVPAGGMRVTALVPHGNVTAQLEQLQDAVLRACGAVPLSAALYPLQPLFCPLEVFEVHALREPPASAGEEDEQARAADWKNRFLAESREECRPPVPVLYPPVFINGAVVCPAAIDFSGGANHAAHGGLRGARQNITSAVQLAFLSAEKTDEREKAALEAAVRQAAKACLFPARIPLRVFRIQTLEIAPLPESSGIRCGWQWNQTAELWVKLPKKRTV
ncbi:MAG: hypothetical protein NC041_09235 [Bacteroides sp.]|nr:hypothetical protein [Prevotella sp.]MCM1408719.1 hypothetical protein [Treponema brennaborense]MCM1470634.1 hypothetical protein [Bacteroides sp.]